MARRQGTQFTREILSRTKSMVHAPSNLCSTDNVTKSQLALHKTDPNHGKINVKAFPKLQGVSELVLC